MTPLRSSGPDDNATSFAPPPPAAEARAAVTALLGDADLLAHVRLPDVLLVLTEMIANAVEHAGGVMAFEARLDVGRGLLMVSVCDADPCAPLENPRALTDPTVPRGRGWALVRLLATDRQVTALPGGGKRITATFALEAPPCPSAQSQDASR